VCGGHNGRDLRLAAVTKPLSSPSPIREFREGNSRPSQSESIGYANGSSTLTEVVVAPIMAKYVEFTPDVFAIQDGGVFVWWFPSSFSQSQLGDRVIGMRLLNNM
jgi:hypothetical protein